MCTRPLLTFPVLLALSGAVLAQEHAPHERSPYAGLEGRPVKALSEQQTKELRAGRGMGFALAAELNGYPGPRHVLELAEPLGLTTEQRARMQELVAAMRGEAVALGEKLIAAEAALDRQFAERTVTPASLGSATREIGLAQGALRAVHLNYHLAVMDVLTPDQVRRYNELRGYADRAGGSHRHGAH